MRIAVGAMSHETNTFTSLRTTLEDFTYATGEAILEDFDCGRSLGGIVDTLRAAGAELRPTLAASHLPSGTVDPEAYRTFKRGITERLGDAETLDGVCLDLHGSMYVEGEPDPEGDLLRAIRATVGDDVPVVGALDMHATITDRMVDAADAFVGYRTAPHTDVYGTGERAAELLIDAIREDRSLAMSWIRMPMLLAGEQSETDTPPMADLVAMLDRMDERDGVASTSYFLGFPWADTPHAGTHAVAVGTATAADRVEATATDLAEAFWDRHTAFEFSTEARPLDEVLDIAAGTDDRPVVVGDSGDIPGAGGTEDVIDPLETMLERGVTDATVAVVADPAAHAELVDAGVGTEPRIELGRRAEDGTPATRTVHVTAVDTYEGVGTALVDIEGIEVFVVDRRTNVHRDPAYFDAFGIDPRDRKLIVLKSGYLSPAWKTVAARRLLALTPGDTNQRLSELDYTAVPRPIYPLDRGFGWSVGDPIGDGEA